MSSPIEFPNDDSAARSLSGRERRNLGKIAEYLQFADLIALLMVVSTAFTAVATWRTATIARALYLAAERPYIGVTSVALDTSHPNDLRVHVIYQNFGHVSADDVLMRFQLIIDGRHVAGRHERLDAGIISPEVPHRFYLHIPNSAYNSIVRGHSTMIVEVTGSYSGGQTPLCYLERFRYVPDDNSFEVAGGSPRCQDQPKN